MTDLTTILDKSLLEFLERDLTKLCEGQVSVVFEDAQSQPITEAGKRVFPDRDGCNICKKKIDCDENEHGHRECLRSDRRGAEMARAMKQGYLYRCHEEKGFPNFLFPIRIWPEEVVGFLYVGQFVFKELENSERDKFLKDLRKSNYYCLDYEHFIAKWLTNDIREFWKHAIDDDLRDLPEFTKDKFSDLIQHQVERYGLSPSRFFDIIRLIEGIADRLSTLGNSFYLLKTLVEIESKLPPLLKARYDSALAEWRKAVSSIVSSSKEKGFDYQKTVATITRRSLEILLCCKKYEDEYIRELIRPLELGIITSTQDSQDWILQFYALSAAYEVIRYSEMRPYVENRSRDLVKKSDDLAFSLLNTIASCGSQFPSFEELSKQLFLKLYRQEKAKSLIEDRFIPSIRNLFDDDTDLQKWLDNNGVDLDINKYPDRTEYFSRSFDIAAQDLSASLDQLQQNNLVVENNLKKGERSSVDISELADHLRAINQLKINLSTQDLSALTGKSKVIAECRSYLDLRAYKIFLNSGGLSPTHLIALNEQNKWLALRNEEGPVGMRLESELDKKVRAVRVLVKDLIDARTCDSIVFTNSTTSSIDLVLRGILRPGDEILVTDLEHDVVFYLSNYFKDRYGCRLTEAKIRQELQAGKDPIPTLIKQVTKRTRLVIVSHVSYGLGVVLPIKKITQAIANCNKGRDKISRIFTLVDGAHAVGNIRVSVRDLGSDFYAFDGHKWLMGPEGTGILYCREEYLQPNSHRIIFPFSNAYMVSPKFLPKNGSGNDYELGTTDVAKILGLGAVLKFHSSFEFSDLANYRRGLVKKLEESLEGTLWQILNSKDALETGIICLRIAGQEDIERYKKSVAFLETKNVAVRFIKKPICLRLCLHYYNNERDVDIAAFHLKSLLEGVDIHTGNHMKVKEKLDELVRAFLSPNKPSSLKSYVGLSIFSVGGSGKTTLIEEELCEDLKKARIQFFKVDKNLLLSKNPEKELSSIFDQAWKKKPAVIFIDEADSWLGENQKEYLGVFNIWANKILGEKQQPICVLAAENDPNAIFESAARRLRAVYFPLPDSETRLKYLQKVAKGRNCSSEVLLPQIARLTKNYTMKDMESLWGETLEQAKGGEICPIHFHKAFEATGILNSDRSARLLQYSEIIQKLSPKPDLLTGEI